jgi:hypothetical protein
MARLHKNSLTTEMCGTSDVFEIDMNESHRCKIVDVKIAGFRRACNVREGG